MGGKCSNPDCVAPINCHEGKENHTECKFWTSSDLPQVKDKPVQKKKKSLTCHGQEMLLR